LVKVLLVAKKVKEDCEPSEVLPGVFLGSVGAAHNKEGLRRCGVTHVLTVAASLAPKHPADFTYCLVDVADRPEEPINHHFERCLKFIAQALLDGGKVLVHCFAGKSRSATICAAYAMATEGTGLRETMARIQHARPIAGPNEGFMNQLRDFEQELVQARQKGRLLGRVQLNAAAATSAAAAALEATAGAAATAES